MPTTNLGLTIIEESDMVSPDPINANMQVLDEKLGVDYVSAKTSQKMVFDSGAGILLGTKVLNFSDSDSQVLFTAQEFSSLTGHDYTWGRDHVSASLGDTNANNGLVCAAYTPNTHQILVYTSKKWTGTYRVEYLIVWMH